MKPLRYKTKKAILGVTLLAILGVTHSFLNRNEYLKPSDFENANWHHAKNQKNIIIIGYENEDIPKNADNEFAYNFEVRKRNQGEFGEYIKLPDLDGNGKVGKK